ncbi:MAG: hypothetical protein R3E46_07380 [Sedimenticolaceae bacterium]
MASNSRTDGHRWRFNQLGGFDQVVIDSAEDILHLPELNQKLWAALSCPTTGVEFDRHTLALLDTDGDGRIRVPEVLAAVEWVCSVLKDPNELFERTRGLPLASIDDSGDEGRQLLASARRILENLGNADAAVITAAETADTNKIFAETRFNGDGVVPVGSAEDADMAKVIEDVIACVGSVPDRSGAEGIDQDLLDRFFAEVTAYSEWWAEAEADAANVRPLGDATEPAASVYEAVEAKINDYFTRARLVAFDAKAESFLNPGEADYTALAHMTLSSATEELAAFPLARVEADRPLSLDQQLNPGWSAALAAFRDQVALPLLGNVSGLTAAQWDDISSRFAAHSAWRARHRGDAVAALGAARVKELAAGDMHAALSALIAQDKELSGVADAIASVDRLVHYYQHLDTLLHNFVSLRDFYSAEHKAIFQAGTLYLDGRSCELCVVVSDVAAHSALATRSQTYLAYCDCRRRGGQEKMTIAAAFTGGDADNLMVGRNGVFYDRTGADWDATIIKVIEHPISISQAFWSPYKRIGRMISQQIEKFAGAQDKAVEDSAAKGVGDLSAKAQDGKAAPFDIGKFAGIFAAIGLAVGAIGTALAAVLTGFLSLSWWEMPLAVGGLMLLVSGPSMIMAYMKLRQRNLGPILDANGWAVNTAARINIPFGSTLTGTAELPRGAQRSMRDPFADKKRPWKFYLFLVIVFVVLGALWQKGYLGEWWDQLRNKAEQASTEVAPAPAEPAPAVPAEAAKPAS